MNPRVQLFGDWDQDSREMLESLKRQSSGFVGDTLHGVDFVDDGSCTHAICFNYAKSPLGADRTVGLLLEPPEILDLMHPDWRWFEPLGTYYSFFENRDETAIDYTWAPGLGFATAEPHDGPPASESLYDMCMIVSDKLMTNEQYRRREFFYALLETDLDVHFYGRGMDAMKSADDRIMGDIPPREKGTVLRNYRYCIDFENSRQGVLTDKFFDPILSNCIPITNAIEAVWKIEAHASCIMISDLRNGYYGTEEHLHLLHGLLNDEVCYFDSNIDFMKMRLTGGDLSLAHWITDRVLERP